MNAAMRIRTHVLVVGGGSAGCRAALAASDAGMSVILANKGPIGRSGITLTAGGGIMAPFHPNDSPKAFFKDIIDNGYGLAEEDLACIVALEACDRIVDLERYGVKFLKNPDGTFDLSQFPGQTVPRNVLFRNGGVGMIRGLYKEVQTRDNVTVLNELPILDLLTDDQGRIAGALGLDQKSGELTIVEAAAVVLATGGYQALWETNDCPSDSTGDGVAMAYRAGASLVDLEMLLFYPSVVIWPEAARGCFVHYEFLSPWALDGEMRDIHGDPVLPKPMPVRDVAMRAMATAINEGRGTERGGLFWDVTCSPKSEETRQAFLDNPQYNHLRALGVEPLRDMVEVAPGAHYQLGGILIDRWGATTVEGLFASPEAAGNFEGTNRLSGSALIGTQVFGARSGKAAARYAVRRGGSQPISTESMTNALQRVSRYVGSRNERVNPPELKGQLKKLTDTYLGTFRDQPGLETYLQELQSMKEHLAQLRVPAPRRFNQALLDILEIDNMHLLGELIAKAALVREESRGHHYRLDYPEADSANLYHTTIIKGARGPVSVRKEVGKCDFSSVAEEG